MSIRYFEAAMKEHREFKLHLLAAACAHCADRDNTDSFDEQLEFFDAIERLQPFHMVILKYIDENHVEKLSGGSHKHEFNCTFDELMNPPVQIAGAEEALAGKRSYPTSKPQYHSRVGRCVDNHEQEGLA